MQAALLTPAGLGLVQIYANCACGQSILGQLIDCVRVSQFIYTIYFLAGRLFSMCVAHY